MLFWHLCYKIAKLGEILQKSKIRTPIYLPYKGGMLQRAKKLSTVN